MDKSRTGLALVFLLGGALVVVGVSVLIASTDFDPNPFLEDDQTNPTGQLCGVLVASSGAVVVAIAAATHAVCRSLNVMQRD